MNEAQKELVMELCVRAVSEDDFLEKFGSRLDGQSLSKQLLEESLESECADDLDMALTVGFRFGFTAQHVDALVKLSKVKWHTDHENVVSAIDETRSPLAVPALFEATQWAPEFGKHVRALAAKAIRAIGKNWKQGSRRETSMARRIRRAFLARKGPKAVG
ncbi:MAG: hypothetical protein JWO89_1688 [Verrucomicrobiaceae bacterium]|nr:hypothetical protein [Verrucomicrobiaceae bacterium]